MNHEEIFQYFPPCDQECKIMDYDSAQDGENPPEVLIPTAVFLYLTDIKQDSFQNHVFYVV